MLTILTLLASMPVAFTKAGQSWNSPPPTSKPIDCPSRSLGLVMFSSLSEKMPMGERGQTPAIATRSRPRPGAARLDRHIDQAEIALTLVNEDADLGRAAAAL